MDKQQEANYIFLSHDQPKHNWRIICPYKQQLQFGTPFLIQDTSNGYYMNIDMFNPKNNESNEFVVVLKKNIETTSLWVVYYMK
ncbi:unnamed protein product [Paramecium primaurelia]|uniref:Uncharacterized protein n=1 Tax=Paramecium primaurelia TaxID=5886 RepID=A0A8S1MGD6_PARPR|nr:unnamed protein product [Paramecium primaurelia]